MAGVEAITPVNPETVLDVQSGFLTPMDTTARILDGPISIRPVVELDPGDYGAEGRGSPALGVIGLHTGERPWQTPVLPV